METPDPPNDTPGASKHVILTPHDLPRILRVPPLEHTPKPLPTGYKGIARGVL